MKIILILGAIILALITVIVIMFLSLKSDKKKIKELSESIEAQQRNILYLYRHAEEVAEIEKDKNAVEGKIKEAKSDEEVLNIINTIISVNNDKL